MKRRLVSLALGIVMLASFGGAVSAAPTNPNAVAKSCHGQVVSLLASSGVAIPGQAWKDPDSHWNNAGERNKQIKADCAESPAA